MTSGEQCDEAQDEPALLRGPTTTSPGSLCDATSCPHLRRKGSWLRWAMFRQLTYVVSGVAVQPHRDRHRDLIRG